MADLQLLLIIPLVHLECFFDFLQHGDVETKENRGCERRVCKGWSRYAVECEVTLSNWCVSRAQHATTHTHRGRGRREWKARKKKLLAVPEPTADHPAGSTSHTIPPTCITASHVVSQTTDCVRFDKGVWTTKPSQMGFVRAPSHPSSSAGCSCSPRRTT